MARTLVLFGVEITLASMRTGCALFCLVWLLAGRPAEAAESIRLTTLELKDQFEQPHVVTFPSEKPRLFVVSDRKGSEQTPAWTDPLKERFTNQLEMIAVADVHGVPAFVQPMIRRGFKKQYAHPVLLDWKGLVFEKLSPKANVVNLYLLKRDGTLSAQWRGVATEASIKLAGDEIERLLKP